MPAEYQRVAAEITRRIDSGAWPVGFRLPPKHQLQVEFEASKYAVDQAIFALRQLGVLRGVQGRGVYVADPSVSP